MQTIASGWMWAAFAVVVIAMLAIDLVGAGNRRAGGVTLKSAALWSAVWVAVSLAFAGLLWLHLDGSAGRAVANAKTLEFITGYLIEKALAVDNVFVWLLLFNFFAVPLALQKRVLTLGVFGAIVLRTLMIFAGVWLIARFHWLLYLFGLFLLFTGIKMWRSADSTPDLAHNPLLNWLRRHLRLTDRLEGEHFFVQRRHAGRTLWYATPLLLALLLVEISDVIFAVDSIPAIFAVSRDPFIVLTSNIFAILGLRAMYFLLAGMADRFTLLKYGLAIVLVFIGAKMLLLDLIAIPVSLSLVLVALIIGASIVLSLRRDARTRQQERERGWKDES